MKTKPELEFRAPVDEGSVNEKRLHLIQLVINSVSPGSRPAYRLSIEQFLDWWTSSAVNASISCALIQHYSTHLKTRALAPRTINLRLAAVRKLAVEAARTGLLSRSIALEVLSVKSEKVPARGPRDKLTHDQTELKGGGPRRDRSDF